MGFRQLLNIGFHSSHEQYIHDIMSYVRYHDSPSWLLWDFFLFSIPLITFTRSSQDKECVIDPQKDTYQRPHCVIPRYLPLVHKDSTVLSLESDFFHSTRVFIDKWGTLRCSQCTMSEWRGRVPDSSENLWNRQHRCSESQGDTGYVARMLAPYRGHVQCDQMTIRNVAGAWMMV